MNLCLRRKGLACSAWSMICTGCSANAGVSSCPWLADFQSPALRPGLWEQAVVTAIEDPENFHLQLASASEELQALMIDIQQYCCGSSQQTGHVNLGLGMPVLAQYSEDLSWYRATVTGNVGCQCCGAEGYASKNLQVTKPLPCPLLSDDHPHHFRVRQLQFTNRATLLMRSTICHCGRRSLITCPGATTSLFLALLKSKLVLVFCLPVYPPHMLSLIQ